MEGFAYLMLTLPFKCNYRCLKCFNLSNDQPITEGQPVELEEILAKTHEAKAMGGKVVIIAGEGEPTLQKDIRTIVSHIDGLGMIPIVYSNGYALTPSIAEFYCKRNTCLVIALDSLKPDVYRLLAGTKGDVLPLVRRNLANLKSVYAGTIEDRHGLRILRLALNMTVCSRNKGEIAEVKAFAGDDMYFVCNPLARHGNAEGNWSVLIDSEEDFAEQQRLARTYSESGGPLTLDTVGLCGYSINGIGIGPYGHYMTCAYTWKTNGLLGTIRDRSLREAYEFKTGIEHDHYSKRGHVPCLVRATSFDSFLISLVAATGNQPSSQASVGQKALPLFG
jgi:MoaA/NifB/PqqE/SkfB family radical SAM enzyme